MSPWLATIGLAPVRTIMSLLTADALAFAQMAVSQIQRSRTCRKIGDDRRSRVLQNPKNRPTLRSKDPKNWALVPKCYNMNGFLP